jgi:RNA polymerase sigma-70 factor (ECF subfamily)
LQTNWNHIIEGCKQQNTKSQEQLYKQFYPVMMKICLRYSNGNLENAASIYNEAMFKVFRNIIQYKGEGSFEGWIKRIVINTSVDHCRKKIKFQTAELNDDAADIVPIIPEVYNRINGNEIIALVHELPSNTGLVFNLYVMEGYKHEEIGKLLGISTGTSKWHLSEARKFLKEKIESRYKKEFLKYAI